MSHDDSDHDHQVLGANPAGLAPPAGRRRVLASPGRDRDSDWHVPPGVTAPGLASSVIIIMMESS